MEQFNETLPHDVVLSGVDNVRTNFERGTYHVQNWAWFGTAFNFERKYFWNLKYFDKRYTAL